MSAILKRSLTPAKRNSGRKSVKSKKIPKTPQKDIRGPLFKLSFDKQSLFKNIMKDFEEWHSWQRRILICKCIQRCSIALLTILSTSLEPVKHRDYQILSNGGFSSTLIKTFFKPEEEDESDIASKCSSAIEKWKTTSGTGRSQKNEIAVAFTKLVKKSREAQFGGISDIVLGKEEVNNHSHALNRRVESLSTIEFLPEAGKTRIAKLGNYVKPISNKKYSAKPVLKEYKHEKIWLPPIKSRKQKFSVISKESLLQTFNGKIDHVISLFNKWSNPEKGDFVLCLINLCSPEDVEFLSNCISQQLTEVSNIDRLPDDTLVKVFSYLELKDLCTVSQVCKRWKLLSSCKELWKPKCYELAEVYNQVEILNYLSSSSVEPTWREIYQELEYSLPRLVDPAVSYAALAEVDTNVDQEEMEEDEDSKSNSEDTEIGYSTPNELAESSTNDSLSSLHAALKKNFGVFGVTSDTEAGSENDLDGVGSEQEENGLDQDSSKSGNVEEAVNEEVAFDVRRKLVQPRNDLKKVANGNSMEEEEFAQVSISGIRSIKRVRKLQGHIEPVLCVQFDSKRIMTGSMDHTVRLWDARSGRNFHKLKGHQGGVRCLQFDKRYITTGSWDTTVMVWDAVRFTQLHVLTQHTGCVSCMELTNRMLVTGSHDSTVCIFEKQSWQLFTTLRGHTGPVSCLLLMSEEELLTGSYDKTILLWDIFETSILRQFAYHQSPVVCLKTSGKLLLSGCTDGTLTFWDLASAIKEGVVKAHDGAVNSVCFIGSRFVTAGGDHLIKEWDLATCTCLRTLTGHKGAVLCLRASSKRLVSGSADSTARIWDYVCSLQQTGGPYDEMNKIVIQPQVIDEKQLRKMTVDKCESVK